MRDPTRAGRRASALRAVWLSSLVLGLSGCATLRATLEGYHTGRDGLAHPQRRQREALAQGEFTRLLEWREDDALLRALNAGVARYYASQFEASAVLLDTAALLADDRITKSVSAGALSLVTNDMARPYQTRRTERLFVPYYAMLAYARLDRWEDAAVEARRLVSLLAQYGGDRDDGERPLHAVLHHLAGAVFERAGEAGDARVAYRAAHALSTTLPDDTVPRLRPGEGELLVVVERGFVAHRASESIEVLIDGPDRDTTTDRREGDAGAPAAALAMRRGMGRGQSATIPPDGIARLPWRLPRAGDGETRDDGKREDDDDHYWMKIAFPVLRRSPRPWGGPVRLAVDDGDVAGVALSAGVDDASESDERRERVAMVARATARAAAKYAAVKAVKDRKGEAAGELANLGAALLERADVRSWHLLPQEITLMRVRVPAGTRALRLRVGEGWATRSVDLEPATVRAGTVTIASVRLWRDPDGPAPARAVTSTHD